MRRHFRIMMQTPIGKRYGHLDAEWENDSIHGKIYILDNTDSFRGSVDENGNCKITGRLLTLTKSVSYTAAGKIGPESLALLMQSESGSFAVTGTPCEEGET